ncbi:MAG: class I SAM-dependent methyltransferase, partial [Nitrospira sp.]|nr:class I SAM-dependent methyltransferase [Nitrospira sp.]
DTTSKISETAFLVNASRARMVEVSRDIYAKLWVSDSTRELWNDFAFKVYPHDDVVVSARSRYFLNHLNAFVSAFESPVFINIGAGFTSYPFLIQRPCKCIEVDYEHIIHFKRDKVAKWQQEGLLPKRDVEYFAADLNHPPDRERLKSQLAGWIGNSPSFILLEGITYFLDRSILTELLETFSGLQLPDSITSFDFWKPDMQTHPIFIRLQNYLAERFIYQVIKYNLLDSEFVRSLQAYQGVEITGVVEQEKLYSKTTVLQNYKEILPENYVILKKIRRTLKGEQL